MVHFPRGRYAVLPPAKDLSAGECEIAEKQNARADRASSYRRAVDSRFSRMRERRLALRRSESIAIAQALMMRNGRKILKVSPMALDCGCSDP